MSTEACSFPRLKKSLKKNLSLENEPRMKFPCISLLEIPNPGEPPSRKLMITMDQRPNFSNLTEVQISLGRSALAPISCVSVKGRGAFGSDFHESLLGKNLKNPCKIRIIGILAFFVVFEFA